MTDDRIELSRRKILAGLGTIGVAGAGAGLGTSAFFSDQETFTNNQLVAGDLDLKVGWEEHYSDWSDDEDDGLQGEVTMGNNQPVGLPTQNSSLISVANTTDARTFLNNTEVGQYPNATDTFDDASGMNGCDILPAGSEQSPVIIDIEDVKPGDFGEVTFAFSLCTNPGYLWLTGGLQDASEGDPAYTEPEREDPDEDGPENEDTVELLDVVQTALWYDDGDNLQSGGGGGGGAADVMIVADGSGSVTTDSSKFQALQDGAEDLVNAVGSNVQVGLTVFSSSASTEATLADSKSTVITEIQDDGNYPGGGTDVGAGITEAQDQLTNGAGARSGVDKVMVVLTNGNSFTGRTAATNAKNAGTTIYGIAYGDGADEDLIEDISSPPKVDDGTITEADKFAFDADETDISSTFKDIGGQITSGEEVFFTGTLREALNALENGGVPLDGDRSTAFDEAGGDPTSDDRECFAGDGEVHYIGFAWWLGVDHANEAQTDTATFELGFYTEQCRHNDGSGMANRPDA